MHGKIDLTKLVPNWQKALKSGIVKKAAECTSLAYWINLDNQSTPINNRNSKNFSLYYEKIWRDLDVHI